MSKLISISENGINLVIEITEDNDVRLLHFSSIPFEDTSIPLKIRKWFRILEFQVSGENISDHHGSKHTGTNPGASLRYKEHKDYRNEFGRKVEIIMENSDFETVSHLQFYNNISIVRSWTTVKSKSSISQYIEYITSFALTGISKEGLSNWNEKCRLYIPHNTWTGEAQWKNYKLQELGLSQVNSAPQTKRISISNTGTWSTSEYLPMGLFENTECGTILFWQIENNGSWHWEIGDVSDYQLYIQLSGPTEQENLWGKELKTGELFETIPVAVGILSGNFEDAIDELTKYRRIIRRPNNDDKNLPVIFNDYMNCLFGDPTEDRLLPLIDKAAEIGCEYFCIDAGWYADNGWWDNVGNWVPSKRRFPNGLEKVLNYIRSKGMIPGLWLELEVMGIKNDFANKLPDNWFFIRHGKRVIDNGRYQLDFRNKDVRNFASDVIDRLVKEYGIGYIKMDYNINAGPGTEINADSMGDGLLSHNRAYLKWLDEIFNKYPNLVIENCSSGGLRLDYALLSRHSIQSSSDQTDYRKYPYISAAIMTAVTPEQCGVWSYPLANAKKEEIIFNLVNAMFMRIHQSGKITEIANDNLNYLKEGISYYKTIRNYIPDSLPFWPLGLPEYSDGWVSLGLKLNNNKSLIAIWRINGKNEVCILPLKQFEGKSLSIKCAYPLKDDKVKYNWNRNNGTLSVVLPEFYTARILEIETLEDTL
ncbi:MAG: alpha-galactosidase [Nitrososphaeria archaeon]